MTNKKYIFTITAAILLYCFSLNNAAFGVRTNYITEDNPKEFLKGELNGISLDIYGQLRAAPGYEEILTFEDLYIFSMVKTTDGNIIIGTGNDGKIYKVDSDGEAALIADLDAVLIKSMVIDDNDVIYASVAPDAKIIRITQNGNINTLFEMEESYVWDITYAGNNLIYAACGEPARIYKLATNGSKTLLYSNDQENNFLCLKKRGNFLYFGGEGTGAVYRYNLTNDSASVLYDTIENEVTDIDFMSSGDLVIATGSPIAANFPSNVNYEDSFSWRNRTSSQSENGNGSSSSSVVANSLYKISQDGEIEKLLTCIGEIFISLLVMENDFIYAGSGNKGVLYQIDNNSMASIMLNTDDEQVLCLYDTGDGNFLAGTGNIGRLLEISPDSTSDGNFISQVFECPNISSWGRIQWTASLNGGDLYLQTRTGLTQEPDNTWSDWSAPLRDSAGSAITSPKGRYIQYKIVIQSTSYNNSPLLSRVIIPYLPDNRRPVIESFDVSNDLTTRSAIENLYASSGSKISLEWEASDPDEDSMIYSLECRLHGQQFWMLLFDEISESSLEIDSRILPDGEYAFRINVSDSPDNNPEAALETSRQEQFITIDNTVPVIEQISVSRSGNQYQCNLLISDAGSNIHAVEYSINGQEWRSTLPVDGIYDSRREMIEFNLPNHREVDYLYTGNNFISIRAIDQFENLVSSGIMFIIE